MTPRDAHLAPGVRIIVVGNHSWPSPPTRNEVDLPVLMGLQGHLAGRVEVIVAGSGMTAERWRADELRITLLPRSSRLTFLRSARRLVADAVSRGPGVLVASDVWGGLACLPSRGTETPLLMQVQGDILSPGPEYGSRAKRASLRAAATVVVRSSDAVRCLNPEIERAVKRAAPDVRTSVLGSRVDTERFRPRSGSTRQGAPKIISVGSLVERKDHATLIRAVAAMRAQGQMATLDIVGSGDQRPELARLASLLGVPDAVSFRGHVPHSALPDAFAASDLFALASMSEGQPRAALEAMASGLPVVLSDIDGHRGLISHGVEGLLVPTRDVEVWAESMARLIHSPIERRSMGRAAREAAVRSHGFEGQIAALALLIRSLAP